MDREEKSHQGGISKADRRHPRHGCQMAIAGFLESYVFGPSGFWTMAPLRYAAKFDPFLSLDCAPRPPPWRNPRKGRDQILPSGNHGSHRSTDIANATHNFLPPTSTSIRRIPPVPAGHPLAIAESETSDRKKGEEEKGHNTAPQKQLTLSPT